MMDPWTHPWMQGLLGDAEMEAIFAPDAELKRFLHIEAAWTRALAQVSDAANGDAIAHSIETALITPESLQEGFAKDGVPIPALVQLLKAQVGPEAASLVHQGLTSQDVMDTSLMLALKDVLVVFGARLSKLEQNLSEAQEQYSAAKLMAYTRMQPALETNGAVVIDRWRQPLSRLLAKLPALTQDVSKLQWGGPIGVRDHLQADRLGADFAANLGLSDPGAAWHTDRSIITDVTHHLMQITTATGKMGEDIALMAAVGPEQITLSGGSSSAMAHKSNPVKAETLISLSIFATSLQATLTRAARHEGFRSGQAWMLEWLALPQLCRTTGTCLTLANDLLDDIETLGQF